MSDSEIEFTAYHGTDKSQLRRLIGNRVLPKPDCNIGDLGKGLYGFIDDRDLALAYAERMKINHQIVHPTVIEFNFKCKQEEIIDFDTPENLQQFLEAKEIFREFAKDFLLKSRSKRICIDGIIIERMLKHNKGKIIKAVTRSTFTPTREDYICLNGRLVPLISNYPNGKELCVRVQNPVKTRRCD